MEVVCIGNATLDVFVHLQGTHLKGRELCLRPGKKIEADRIFFASGGSATNTSVSFARLGIETGIVCALGKDGSAKRIVSELRREKIDCRGIVRLSKFQTAYSAILTGFGADRIILTYGGATTHLEKENQVDWGLLKKTEWVYAGSFHSKPKILKKIFDFAYGKGVLVAWNPGRSELKQGLKKLRALLSKTTVLFLNKGEAEELAKGKDLKKNLQKLQGLVPLVVITLGAKGSIAFDGKKFYRQSAKKAKVFDTTGCGDAFNSGFVAAIIRGKGIKGALKLGSENAASVIGFAGAKNRLLRKKI